MSVILEGAHAQPQRKVDRLLDHYGISHQHPVNERIHFVAIPMIMLSVLGLLFAVHPWVAYAAVAASMVYYARLSAVFFVCMGVIVAAMLAAVHAMGTHVLWISAVIFVVAWIFQFIGHHLEGRKPSFIEDIQYLWVGPLFVLSRLFLHLKIRW